MQIYFILIGHYWTSKTKLRSRLKVCFTLLCFHAKHSSDNGTCTHQIKDTNAQLFFLNALQFLTHHATGMAKYKPGSATCSAEGKGSAINQREMLR